jgi:hypothetical protein
MYVNLDPNPDAIDVIRIDEHDTWDFDRRIARVILPMLLQFRLSLNREHFSFPSDLNPVMEFYYDDQLVFDFLDADAEIREGEARATDVWRAHVDAMIWSFDRIVKDPNLMGFKDHGGYDAYQERVQRGVSLFAKFFFSLYE